MALAIILMGVSGCGKSSVGNLLANKLGWPFYDGDEFHPKVNIDKMARGIPLDDADRQSWLERLHVLIEENLHENRSLVVACSTLKSKYRQTLVRNSKNITFIHLSGSFDLIHDRMKQRIGHYMKAEMLRSQFADLEIPQNAITVSIDQSVEEIVSEIVKKTKLFGECI